MKTVLYPYAVDIIPAEVKLALQVLTDAGYSCFVAGGAVRDVILGRKPNDWDIATSATPDETEAVFATKGIRSEPTGKIYGTISVYPDGNKIEITTYRLDGEYCDGRRPKNVQFTTDPEQDVIRRDSTINGLLMDENGLVYDYVDGIFDIKFKTIRAIGCPSERITQDKIRMFRYVRQATQLGFKIDRDTMTAIQLFSYYANHVAGEAIWMELSKILTADECGRGIRLMHESGLLYNVLPEVHLMYGFDQKNKHHSRNLFDHCVLAMELMPADPILRFTALIHDIGKCHTQTFTPDGQAHYYDHNIRGAEMAKEICERFKFSNADTNRVVLLIREHMSKFGLTRRSALKRFIQRVGEENLEDLFQLQLADTMSQAPPFMNEVSSLLKRKEKVHDILAEKPALRMSDLAVNGNMLIAEFGLNKGKLVGDMLRFALDEVIEERVANTGEDLISAIRKEFGDRIDA